MEWRELTDETRPPVGVMLLLKPENRNKLKHNLEYYTGRCLNNKSKSLHVHLLGELYRYYFTHYCIIEEPNKQSNGVDTH